MLRRHYRTRRYVITGPATILYAGCLLRSKKTVSTETFSTLDISPPQQESHRCRSHIILTLDVSTSARKTPVLSKEGRVFGKISSTASRTRAVWFWHPLRRMRENWSRHCCTPSSYAVFGSGGVIVGILVCCCQS